MAGLSTRFMRYTNLITLPLLLALVGCTDISPQARWLHASQLTRAESWEKLRIPTGKFVLSAYASKAIARDDTLTVYIEGDGFAWVTGTQVSDDPTPRNPVGLELALRHPYGAAAYLARPCQYTEIDDTQNCQPTYWTNRRFSHEVIEASSEAITVLKHLYSAEKLVLVGYSGGGAVATLVAARRNDVVRLITVAGTLDHRTWTQHHNVLPLDGSLNPADEWSQLENLPQLHFVGEHDKIMPTDVAQAFAARFPDNRRPEVRNVPGFDHSCCWIEQWRKILPPLFISH